MFIDNPQLLKVRSAAKALLHAGEKMPPQRCEELENIIKDYYNVESVTDEILQESVQTNTKVENSNFAGLHGERVVKSVTEAGELEDFVRMWRTHFLEYMQPRFLPEMWCVDHNLQKLKSQQVTGEEVTHT